jgi:glycosyltransferase involved in cell wall biosynthesis
MNFVFDKKSLKVISVFSDSNSTREGDVILKEMFPNRFRELSLWNIKKDFSYNPIHLQVSLDKEDNPDILLYKGQEIYKCSEEEKKERQNKRIAEATKRMSSILPRNLRYSITSGITKFWGQSIYTKPYVSKKIKSFEYFAEKTIMPVSWWGPFTDAGGYANMNREIVFRLHNYHVIPKIDICPTAPQVSAQSQYYISKYASLDLRRVRNYPRVWSFTPIPHPPHKGKNIFFTMMETESLHPEFARICNVHSNEIWVPSVHNKNVFEKYGVKKPIHVMPLGIDENLYRNANQEPIGVIKDASLLMSLLGKPKEEGINSFRFISLFGWSYRKGVDILIKSFVEAFKGNDDVALIIVSRHAGSPAADHINVIQNETMRYAKSVRKSNFPQILLYPHIVPEQQMPSIYRMGHVFVHCSRGEGFSLPQIEASACGLPVISCNNTGMTEYLTDDNAFLIKHTQKEVCSPEMHWITSYYHGQLFPKLGKEQIHQAKKHMRYVVNNYDEAVKKGGTLTRQVFGKYTWDHATARVAKRIEEIYQEK